MLSASELLKVGSFHEGTKILQPDEFDFLVVIGELSRPGVTEADIAESEPGYARVKIVDEATKGKWTHRKGGLKFMENFLDKD